MQSAGFEPAREDPILFLVRRLNHSAKTAGALYNRERHSTSVFKSQILCGLLIRVLIVFDRIFGNLLVSIY